MTIVVGIEHEGSVYLGCDSQGSAGWEKIDRKDPKVFTAHGIGYGFTSSYRMGQILRFHSTEVLSSIRKSDPYRYVVTCLVPMYREILGEHGYKTTKDGEERGGTFLIAVDGHLYTIENDFQVSESSADYAAVGCGFAYALGHLYATQINVAPEDRLLQSIAAAVNFSNGCGGKTIVLRVGD